MANDYTFNFTDPTKTPFIVKPYTVNGYAAPDSSPIPPLHTTGGVTAVSANTSLVFVGKGMPDYGDTVQNNFIYLLEHFANPNPPIAPTQGQIWYKNADYVDVPNPTEKGLYVYNGSSWDTVVMETATGVTSDIDMGGLYRVINHPLPINPTDATTKQYVDDSITDIHGINLDTNLHLNTTDKTLLDGITVTFVDINQLAGVTSPIQGQFDDLPTQFTALSVQFDDKVDRAGDTMLGNLSLGSNRIVSLAEPILSDDAATKSYVDTSVGALSSTDGVVNAGSLNPITGVLTLSRTIGTPVVVSGLFASQIHNHTDAEVTHNVSAPISQSYIVSQALNLGTYPSPPVYDSITYLDQAVYDSNRPVHREMITAPGGVTSFDLSQGGNRPDMEYNVGENKLQVFMNGVKQYASECGKSVISLYNPIIGLTSDTGLAISTPYSFDITVDGGVPDTVTITTPAMAPYTFLQLLLDIDTELVSLSLPVAVGLEQYLDRIEFIFTSHTFGSGSAVTVSFGVGSLFDSIVTTSTSAPVNSTITTNYAYAEFGLPGEPSTQIDFTSAPTAGDVIEILLLP